MCCAITAPRRSAGAAVVVCILLALTQTLDAQQPPRFADAAWQAEFDRDVEYLSALEPRAEGSTAELHAAEYVQRRLSAMGLSPELRFLNDPLSATVEAVVPGALPDSLLVAVPLAPPAPAPGDSIAVWRRLVEPTVSGIAPAVALGFARSLAGAPQPPPITVRFLFLGAEHGAAEQGYPAGSRRFLQEFQAGAPVAVLYLDLRGIPSHLVPYAGGAGIESPPWLHDRVVTALQAAGNPLRLTRANTIHLVRLGLTPRSLLAPFHRAGLPGLLLAGQYRPLDDSESLLWPDRMQEFLALLLASFADGVPDEWGRHYLLFNRPRSPLIVAEPDYLLALILVLGLAITYLFAVSTRLRFFLAPLWRDLWRIPLLAAVTFAAVSAGTAAVRLLPVLRGTPTLWHEAPLLFVTLKLTVALLTAALLRYVAAARWFPQPRRQPVARFYWAAAVVLLFALGAGAAALNIALAFPLVWALLCALLATTSDNPWVRVLWILPAPLWIIAPARGLLSLPRAAVRGVGAVRVTRRRPAGDRGGVAVLAALARRGRWPAPEWEKAPGLRPASCAARVDRHPDSAGRRRRRPWTYHEPVRRRRPAAAGRNGCHRSRHRPQQSAPVESGADRSRDREPGRGGADRDHAGAGVHSASGYGNRTDDLHGAFGDPPRPPQRDVGSGPVGSAP